MSKSEMVIELQTILKDLKNITLNLDDNISNLRDFLDNERFIPEELGNEIRGQLEDINKKQKEISLKYRMLNADGNTASYAVLEEELFELQKVIEENEKYIGAIQFFLALHSENQQTEEMLQIKKEVIKKDQVDLMEGDTLKNYAEPYVWMQQAFQETDARKKFSLVYKLASCFEENIVSEIQFGTLILNETDRNGEEQDDSFREECEQADEIFHVSEEAVKKEEECEDIADEVIENEDLEDIASDEFEEDLKKLFVKENTSILHVQMSPKASSKFGVKEFKKDIIKQLPKQKVDCMLEALNGCGYSIKSITEKKDDTAGDYKVATEKLYQQGYLKRYVVDGMGEFFTLSLRGERAFQAKDALSFINHHLMEKVSFQERGEEIEDTANSAIVRILLFDSVLKQRKLEPEYKFLFRESEIGTDYFMVGYQDNTNENTTWFAGVITEHTEEMLKFKKLVSENVSVEDLLVISGNSLEQAKMVADWAEESFDLETTEVYYTSYFEKNIFNQKTGLPLEVKKEVQKSDENVDDTEVDEPEEVEVAVEVNEPEEVKAAIEVDEPEEAKVVIETNEQEKVETDMIAGETKNQQAEQEEAKKQIQEIAITKSLPTTPEMTDEEKRKYIEDCQKMIISGEVFAASAYLKALSEKNDSFESHYRQLAYAMNDPMENCTYSSTAIFDVFYGDTEAVSDYYIIAAALRNYFYDQYSYDYSIQQLYSMLKVNNLLRSNQTLEEVMYDLVKFKNEQHKGIDRYADYREKERSAWEERLAKIRREAKGYYENYGKGKLKESTSHKRFIETTKLLLGADSDLCQYLKMVVEDDRDMLDMLEDFLADTYVKDQAVICVENIDPTKIHNILDEYWNRATENMFSVKKTSDLMSSLRMSLYKKVYKIVSVLCDYVFVMQSSFTKTDDISLQAYKKIGIPLLNNIRKSIDDFSKKTSVKLSERAGETVLVETLKELESRLSGEYKEGTYKFYYIDFLKNDKVLLDENYLPILEEVPELPDFSVMSRIRLHCEEEDWELTDRLQNIFEGEDDYGSAELILKYLDFQGYTLSSEESERYDIEKAIIYPEKDLENKRKEFIEDIELAQSYGQIDSTVENSKETMLQIMEAWYLWAVETRNYGFFAKILQAFREKIKKGAQDRALDLQKSLEVYMKENTEWEEDELVREATEQIRERIKQQNYAAAEDLLNRVLTNDLDPEIGTQREDYLADFLEEYDVNYKKTANPRLTLRSLINLPKANKDVKGGNRLLGNWPKGAGVGETTLTNLLSAMGFQTKSVRVEAPIAKKIENYLVMLKRPENGRKSNYKHPIAAFGSEAEEKGFRVICIFGKTDASRLIDVFKEVGNAKNTLVLLDYALTLADRRILARKTKTDISGKIFAVVDRVVLTYLAKHYSETAINRMLMAIIMPFASYQPYIDKSADVMPPEIFMGRKYELEKIESATGVNIVYGGRQLGKSALLRMAKKDIDHNENGDRAILVEVRNLDYKASAKKISAALFDEGFLKEEHITDDWSELARDIKKRLKDPEDVVPYFLLLIDEADKFIESSEKVEYQPFDALKDIQSIGSERFKFVVAGLRNIVRFKREVALGNNSVLAHMGSLTVKPFKSMEARELLEEPLSYLGFRFPKDNDTEVLISTIFGTTNYFPGLLQLYCTKLIEAVQRNYVGYSESETPPYIVKKDHIKKVLAEQSLQHDIRKKFFITLKDGDDDYYYIIALLVAYDYHDDKSKNGCNAEDILKVAKGYSIRKISTLGSEKVNALMEEMHELNVLQHTGDGRYRFARYSFCQMMGTVQQIDDELMEYMED